MTASAPLLQLPCVTAFRQLPAPCEWQAKTNHVSITRHSASVKDSEGQGFHGNAKDRLRLRRAIRVAKIPRMATGDGLTLSVRVLIVGIDFDLSPAVTNRPSQLVRVFQGLRLMRSPTLLT